MSERRRHTPSDERPDPADTLADEPDAYDALDEAVMETFPGSDPIAVGDAEPLSPEVTTDGRE